MLLIWRLELPQEGGRALLDHGLELHVVDVGQGQVEDVAGAGGERGEEAVEEDGVEDALGELRVTRQQYIKGEYLERTAQGKRDRE